MVLWARYAVLVRSSKNAIRRRALVDAAAADWGTVRKTVHGSMGRRFVETP